MWGQDGWILASFFFCEFMDRDEVEVHKLAKKERGQYPAILTSHLVNNPYLLPYSDQFLHSFLTYEKRHLLAFPVYIFIYQLRCYAWDTSEIIPKN